MIQSPSAGHDLDDHGHGRQNYDDPGSGFPRTRPGLAGVMFVNHKRVS
jgi:hypothetical protein